MSMELEFDTTGRDVIYTVVPMSNEVFDEIESRAASKLQRRDPAYEYHVEEINQIFAANPKLVGVLERGEITALSESDVEDLVRVIDLHMSSDIMFRKAIYHEGVLSGLRMQKDFN